MMILEKLVAMLGKLAGVVVELADEGVYRVTVNAGRLPSGLAYSGLWGAGTTTGNELVYTFLMGDLYDEGEFELNPLTVTVATDSEGLVYTSELEQVLSDRLASATGGLFDCSGSEQGMQDYYAEDGVIMHEFSADVELNYDLLAVSNAA